MMHACIKSATAFALGLCASLGVFAQSSAHNLEQSPKAGGIPVAEQKAAMQSERPQVSSSASDRGAALYAKMAANQSNADFDMAHAIGRLRQLGYYYPFSAFTPGYEPVQLSGDKAADKARIQASWKAYHSSSN